MAEEISSFATSATSADITIEPSAFDLVVCGTGLPESLLASAASAAGKSVLHVDPNSFYGSHFSSLSPHSLISFLHQKLPPSQSGSSSRHDRAHLELRNLYVDVEVHGDIPEPSGGFLLDVSGPRLMYCADPMVDVMLRSGAMNHVDFKSLDGSLFYWEGRLCAVPDSREGIFKDKSLSLTEKSQMMRFLKMVKGYVVGEGGDGAILEEDLETPFVEFLEKQRLPKKIQSIILYAIAMAVYDQDNQEEYKRMIKTKEGLESLALYSSSLGRFLNATGAFIYPIYGQGELPQAFCRCAAVKGAIYVLRMPVASLLINEDNRQCEGVRLGSGQDISCQQLVLDPSFTIPSSISPDLSDGVSEDVDHEKTRYAPLMGKVARMVCITRRSIQPDLSNTLVVFPPKSLHTQQLATIRALQLSNKVAFCPPELFVIYLSAPCEDVAQGKEFLHAAVDALFSLHGDNESVPSEGTQEAQPALLWNVVYIHELAKDSCDKFFSCPLPDSNLDYRNILETTIKLFQEMYPGVKFFPEGAADEDIEGDEGSLE